MLLDILAMLVFSCVFVMFPIWLARYSRPFDGHNRITVAVGVIYSAIVLLLPAAIWLALRYGQAMFTRYPFMTTLKFRLLVGPLGSIYTALLMYLAKHVWR